MLPRQHRLRASNDFARVYKSGKTLKTTLFRISTAKNGDRPTRVGVVVANKLEPSAVQRNELKRRVRAQLYPIAPQLIPGYDIVVLPQINAKKATAEELQQDLVRAFAKIGFLAN